jgi:hypothetical protein
MRPGRCWSTERGALDRDCDQRRGRRCQPTIGSAKAEPARPRDYRKDATTRPAQDSRSPEAMWLAHRSAGCARGSAMAHFPDWWSEWCWLERGLRLLEPLGCQDSARGSPAEDWWRWLRRLEMDFAKPSRSPREGSCCRIASWFAWGSDSSQPHSKDSAGSWSHYVLDSARESDSPPCSGKDLPIAGEPPLAG